MYMVGQLTFNIKNWQSEMRVKPNKSLLNRNSIEIDLCTLCVRILVTGDVACPWRQALRWKMSAAQSHRPAVTIITWKQWRRVQLA